MTGAPYRLAPYHMRVRALANPDLGGLGRILRWVPVDPRWQLRGRASDPGFWHRSVPCVSCHDRARA